MNSRVEVPGNPPPPTTQSGIGGADGVIEVSETDTRRTDRKTCRHCEASAAGCRSNAWLRGRNCCDACTGNHDLDVEAGRPW